MNWKFYIIWLITFLAGVIFGYVLPDESLSPSLRYIFLGVWGSVLGALFNVITSRMQQNKNESEDFDAAVANKPATQLIPIVDGKEAPEAEPTMQESLPPKIIAPEFPDAEWIDFTQEILKNHPFPKVVKKLSAILPRIFKNASGVLYMYDSASETDLAQIFAFGPHEISDTKISQSACACFDNAKIAVADYSNKNQGKGCTHMHARPIGYSFCAPIEGLEERFGLLTIQVDELPQGETVDLWKTKVSMIATTFGLFVANQNLQHRFQSQSLRDQLTDLVNKRYMEDALKRAVSEARRHGTPIGMIMLHPDNFEEYQNTKAKHVADQLLWELAQRLPRYIRAEDIPCRFNEDTLCIILPGADKHCTQTRAEKIRYEIENLLISYGDETLRTTLSIGISTFPENANDAASLIVSAEQAMHESEALGKNRVSCSHSTAK